MDGKRNTRMTVTHEVPHGTLWRRGLRLAEDEIEAGRELSRRWRRGIASAEDPLREDDFAAIAA